MRHDSPVIAAAQAGDVDRLVELLDAAPESVNVRGWMGITPLIAATWEADSAPAVRVLLDGGADPLAARTNGDGALHWAVSGEVAELLVAAAGPAGLAMRYLGETPLHVAVRENRRDVVRAFLAAGADTTVRDWRGFAPLELAGDPRVARMLIEAGAPVQAGSPYTPLHAACERVRADERWLPVAGLLLERGADPGLRDRFGALPSDLVGDDGPRELRQRLVAGVEAAGRSAELTLEEAAVGPHERVVVHPDRPEALTTMYCGTVLVRWRLAPSIVAIEVIRDGSRTRIWGPDGVGTGPRLAFATGETAWLRDWADPRRSRAVAPGLLPYDQYGKPNMLHGSAPVLSPDGRRMVLVSCESIRLVDLERGEVTGECEGFGDWSVVPRFTPDGTALIVGNSMQGTWWLTVLDIGDDGSLRIRYERFAEDGVPTSRLSEIVTDLSVAPDGRRFATWVRPDSERGRPGYRGLVATTWTRCGEPAWHLPIDDAVTGIPGDEESAALCFTSDGSWLAIGLDAGVVWVDAETGTVAGRDCAVGPVNGLAASRDGAGVLAATGTGLRRLDPPPRRD